MFVEDVEKKDKMSKGGTLSVSLLRIRILFNSLIRSCIDRCCSQQQYRYQRGRHGEDDDEERIGGTFRSTRRTHSSSSSSSSFSSILSTLFHCWSIISLLLLLIAILLFLLMLLSQWTGVTEDPTTTSIASHSPSSSPSQSSSLTSKFRSFLGTLTPPSSSSQFNKPTYTQLTELESARIPPVSTLPSPLAPTPTPTPNPAALLSPNVEAELHALRQAKDVAEQKAQQLQQRVEQLEKEGASGRKSNDANSLIQTSSTPANTMAPLQVTNTLANDAPASGNKVQCRTMASGESGSLSLHCHTDAFGHWLAATSSFSPSLAPSIPAWGYYDPLRLLISSWIRGLIDWHHLVPPALPGDSGDLALDRLIMKERETMQMLLAARDNQAYGPVNTKLFNPDLQYCPKLADKCVVHRDRDECSTDGFCVWSKYLELCVSRSGQMTPDGLDGQKGVLWPAMVWDTTSNKWIDNTETMDPVNFPDDMSQGGGRQTASPASPQAGFVMLQNVGVAVSADGASTTLHTYGHSATAPRMTSKHNQHLLQTNDCDVWIDGRTYLLDMGHNAQMFWHFVTEQLLGVQTLYTDTQQVVDHPERVHFVFRKNNARGEFNPLWQWFHVHTLHCWQHISELRQHGRICFDTLLVQRGETLVGGGGDMKAWTSHAVKRVGLDRAWSTKPKTEWTKQQMETSAASIKQHPLTVGFVSRQDKRIILNEPELRHALSSTLSISSLSISYESLPMHLQLAASRQSDILVGIHGSGLLNTIFMRSGTAELQIVPPGLWTDRSYVACYVDTASRNGVKYEQMDVRGEERGTKHWHFAGQDGQTSMYRQKLADQGTRALESGMVRIMFIQQDANVPVQEFTNKIQGIIGGL